jgi:hypothetical protein
MNNDDLNDVADKIAATIDLININYQNEVTGPLELREYNESGDYSILIRRVELSDISELYFPDTVSKIAPYAFSGARNLTTVVMPDSVMEIGEGAFENCPRLHQLRIPANAKVCWKGINDIEKLDISGSNIYRWHGDNMVLTKDGKRLKHVHLKCSEWREFLGRPARQCTIPELVIPESVTTIGKYAFDGCYEFNDVRDEISRNHLGGIVLPSGVVEIEEYAFYNSGFTEISIPDTVKKIGHNAFQDCIFLEKIHGLEKVHDIGPDVCKGCNRLTSSKVN